MKKIVSVVLASMLLLSQTVHAGDFDYDKYRKQEKLIAVVCVSILGGGTVTGLTSYLSMKQMAKMWDDHLTELSNNLRRDVSRKAFNEALKKTSTKSLGSIIEKSIVGGFITGGLAGLAGWLFCSNYEPGEWLSADLDIAKEYYKTFPHVKSTGLMQRARFGRNHPSIVSLKNKVFSSPMVLAKANIDQAEYETIRAYAPEVLTWFADNATVLGAKDMIQQVPSLRKAAADYNAQLLKIGEPYKQALQAAMDKQDEAAIASVQSKINQASAAYLHVFAAKVNQYQEQKAQADAELFAKMMNDSQLELRWNK